jgi:hypothetical protein
MPVRQKLKDTNKVTQVLLMFGDPLILKKILLTGLFGLTPNLKDGVKESLVLYDINFT